ncbi:hypothetical protein SDC9_148720 [bioreactor metagenome]|uniref:Uncharacterized protein n=1 Tax=bioreactor metagenome TaxID=1076179 RepID=A0A645EHV0_9ZZZZ
MNFGVLVTCLPVTIMIWVKEMMIPMIWNTVNVDQIFSAMHFGKRQATKNQYSAVLPVIFAITTMNAGMAKGDQSI